MKRLRWTLFWVCLVLMCMRPMAAKGEEQKEPVTELEDITVSAQREDQAIKDLVGEEDLEIQTVSGSVLNALENQPGIQLKRSSISGADGGMLRLRGLDETRLRIARDGIPLNRDGSYGNGPVDWSVLSSENVDHIEIYRGAGPAKFGNTLGGVVNIVTKQPGEQPKTVVSTAYGSLNTWDSSILHAWKVGRLGWTLSGGHFESDGYLRNNTMDRNNLSALVTLDLPGKWQLGGGFEYSKKESGMPVYNRPDSLYFDGGSPEADEKALGGPGIGGRLIDGVSAWGDGSQAEDENSAWTAFVEKEMGKGGLRLDFRLWNQDKTETYVDAADSSKKIYVRDTQAEDNNWSVQGNGFYQFDRHLVELGGEMRKYGWGDQTVSYIDESYFNGSINFFRFIREGFKGQPDLLTYSALYLQDNWSFHPDFDLEIGLRQEWFDAGSVDPEAFGFTWPAEVTDMDEQHLDPRLALTYRPWASASVTARFGIAHRYPTSPEYFWWYLNNGSGYFNTDFNAEEAYQYELSWEQKLADAVAVALRGYYYDIADYITSTTVSGVGSVYYNIGRVEIKGLELGFNAELPRNVEVWANATLQQADKADDPWDTDNQLSRQLPDLPEKMVNAGVTYTLNDRFNARLWMNWVDEREHLDGSDLVTLKAYTLVNASADYQVWQSAWAKANLFVTAQNLLGDDYEEEEGYPMPGATVMGGVRMEF